MKNRYIFVAGAGYGLAMRFAFGMFSFLNKSTSDLASGPMLASFVMLVPLLIGASTVYALRTQRIGFGKAIVAPWIPLLIFVAGTAVLLWEGSICIAMAAPIFMLMASVGGVAALLLLKMWQPSSGVMYSLALLPFLAAAFEVNAPMPNRLERSSAAIHIDAPSAKIWDLINNATQIQPSEMGEGVAYMIGVPYPIEAVTHEDANGRIRKLLWDKGVSFDEPILAWEENQYIKWSYQFRPDSFPRGALDEHVLIGGKYFDLIDTSYRLTPEEKGTRLEIVVNYRVSTNFNWYAAAWGRLMVDNSAEAILNFYKQRSEQKNTQHMPAYLSEVGAL